MTPVGELVVSTDKIQVNAMHMPIAWSDFAASVLQKNKENKNYEYCDLKPSDTCQLKKMRGL